MSANVRPLPGELTPYVVIYDVSSSQNIVDVRLSPLFDHVPIVGFSRKWYEKMHNKKSDVRA